MAISAKDIDRIPSLTLSELEKSDGASIWVINMTGSKNLKDEFPRGIINIAVNDGVGNITAARVPITWVPIDMTTQVTKSALIANPQFRRLASAGALKVISEDDANLIINTPEGRKETTRIYAAASKHTSEFDTSKYNADVSVNAADISAIVMSVVTRDDLDEESSLRILEGHEITFDDKDFEYLAKNSKFAGVKDWAINRMG